MSSEALESISTDDLMREVQRRIDCATKPEKRVILIGASLSFLFFFFNSTKVVVVVVVVVARDTRSRSSSSSSSSSCHFV